MKMRLSTLRFLDREEIEALIETHKEAPHQRALQKRLAEEVTTTVHDEEALKKAIAASNMLFGKSTSEDLKSLDEATFLDVFEGVPQAEIAKTEIEAGLDMIAALAEKTGFLKSNGEARRALKENSISLNKEKVGEDRTIQSSDLINDTFILLQRGKKNYFLIRAV
jgi:tyrosyl-tRNA synthetase